MSVDWQTFVVSVIVGAALFYVVRHIVNEWLGSGSGGCGRCSCRPPEQRESSASARDGQRVSLGSVRVNVDHEV